MEKFTFKSKHFNIRLNESVIDGAINYIHHPDTVVCIFEENGKYLLVDQYRPIFEKWLLEFPGGVAENNESIEEAIYREFLEETGYKLIEFKLIFSFASSVGLTDEMIHVFKATKAIKIQKPSTNSDEYIILKWKDINEIEEMISNKLFIDGKSIIAFLINKNAT